MKTNLAPFLKQKFIRILTAIICILKWVYSSRWCWRYAGPDLRGLWDFWDFRAKWRWRSKKQKVFARFRCIFLKTKKCLGLPSKREAPSNVPYSKSGPMTVCDENNTISIAVYFAKWYKTNSKLLSTYLYCILRWCWWKFSTPFGQERNHGFILGWKPHYCITKWFIYWLNDV